MEGDAHKQLMEIQFIVWRENAYGGNAARCECFISGGVVGARTSIKQFNTKLIHAFMVIMILMDCQSDGVLCIVNTQSAVCGLLVLSLAH